jgi:hypothetical protein
MKGLLALEKDLRERGEVKEDDKLREAISFNEDYNVSGRVKEEYPQYSNVDQDQITMLILLGFVL